MALLTGNLLPGVTDALNIGITLPVPTNPLGQVLQSVDDTLGGVVGGVLAPVVPTTSPTLGGTTTSADGNTTSVPLTGGIVGQVLDTVLPGTGAGASGLLGDVTLGSNPTSGIGVNLLNGLDILIPTTPVPGLPIELPVISGYSGDSGYSRHPGARLEPRARPGPPDRPGLRERPAAAVAGVVFIYDTSGTGGTNLLGGLPSTAANTAGPLPSVYTAYANIFRDWSTPPPAIQAQLDTLNAMVLAGTLTAKAAILQIVHASAPYTGVAVASYQFLTALTPTAEGLNYLVNSVQNSADLNDAYYQPFNTENRYINFVSNLGLHGDGQAEFVREYGSLTFDAAVTKAYGKIVGFSSATNGGFDAGNAVSDIVSRRGYFEQIANERFGNDNHDLAVKASAIGYILQEAVRAGVGLYGDATENFLFDAADGTAQYHIDLVGVYGPLSTYNVD